MVRDALHSLGDVPTTQVKKKPRVFEPASSAYVHQPVSGVAAAVHLSGSGEDGSRQLESCCGLIRAFLTQRGERGLSRIAGFGIHGHDARGDAQAALVGPHSSLCRTGRLYPQSAILSHTFTFSPPPYAQSDALNSPP